MSHACFILFSLSLFFKGLICVSLLNPTKLGVGLVVGERDVVVVGLRCCQRVCRGNLLACCACVCVCVCRRMYDCVRVCMCVCVPSPWQLHNSMAETQLYHYSSMESLWLSTVCLQSIHKLTRTDQPLFFSLPLPPKTRLDGWTIGVFLKGVTTAEAMP